MNPPAELITPFAHGENAAAAGVHPIPSAEGKGNAVSRSGAAFTVPPETETSP